MGRHDLILILLLAALPAFGQTALKVDNSTFALKGVSEAQFKTGNHLTIGVDVQAFSTKSNTVFADISGNDGTGTRGNSSLPFLTLSGAKGAASSGDTIFAGPGTYTSGVNIAKNGVNWDIRGNLTYTGSAGFGFFDDSATGANGTVISDIRALDLTNNSTYSGTAIGGIVYAVNSGSTIRLTARDITFPDVNTSGAAIVNSGGNVDITARTINAAAGLGWYNGDMKVRASLINGTNAGFAAIGASVNVITPTGKMWVTADQITGLGQGIIANEIDTTPTSQEWIDCKELNCANDPIYISGTKFYGRFEKITLSALATSTGSGYPAAAIGVQGGKNWISVQKVQGYILQNLGGELHLLCSDWEDANGGTDYSIRVTADIAAGSTFIEGGTFKAVTANGALLSGGTLRLHNVTLDTSAVAAANPITVTGGTLILDHCTLVSHSGQACIYATSGQTVICIDSSANTAVDSHITVHGSGLTIDSNVQ